MSKMLNKVYIAASLDGYIADKDGSLEWLQSVPNPDGLDLGYKDFMNGIDAIIMGRVTYETVLGFGIEWPYNKPVFVLSTTLKTVPEELVGKVEIINGLLPEIVDKLNKREFNNLYIDGGSTVQNFLKEGLIHEIIITTIPVLLGGGAPLFGELSSQIELEHIKTEVFLNEIVQSHYRVKQ